METYLITGGAGFIGSSFINMLLQDNPRAVAVNFDKLTYAGNLKHLEQVSHNRNYRFIHGDICCSSSVHTVFEQYKPDFVINFAAETHVDRSIQDDAPFVRTNVLGTQVLLQASLRYGVKRYLQISTDEVYGESKGADAFTEASPLKPGNPYAASKASADLLVLSYHHTFGLPALVTRCCNNYGPCQHPEKLIPMVISKCLKGERIPIYGDGLQARDWLYVRDHCRAVYEVLSKGAPGQVYNISAYNEVENIRLVEQMIEMIHAVLPDGAERNGKPGKHLMAYVEDRKGHDRCYRISSEKIRRELGWEPEWNFREGLRDTIRWHIDHREAGCEKI